MEWVLRSPQIHSTFGNLGFLQADGYHVNENCNAALETILHNILTEDKFLRTYRRSISFGQNIKKDLIPLLIHAKDDKTIELLVRVLVNLTIPIECLLSVDIISKSDLRRHTVFEINNLLVTTKIAFTDPRPTRVIIDFLKKKMVIDQKARLLSLEQCTNISNLLLLLRNILHIPEENNGQSPNYNGQSHGIQNQIVWNIFSQGIDKVLIKLMIIPDATNWGVTMVQLIALLYKDQHVSTLHKLLNLWLEASLSESSEDNESNTSSLDRGSEVSSPMVTSDQTSASSDTGGSGKSDDEPSVNSANDSWNDWSVANTIENLNESFKQPFATVKKPVALKNVNSTLDDNKNLNSSEYTDAVIRKSNDSQYYQFEKGSEGFYNRIDKKTAVISENSDCGYGTRIENQEYISTSSNEDELPMEEPVHQKPHNSKQRANCKGRSGITIQEKKRKKIVKRGKSHYVINVQGLLHKTPTDDDISNVLKEFTVDFLLRGYNSLVQTLHNQILTNSELEIDTSHFFWLVTYFLKFATQIELDAKHVSYVLSFNIVTYLTAEGVNLCEQFELAIKLDGNDLKPSIRRLHLVVTAIREFVQAIEVYKKFSHISKDDQNVLNDLQIKMCETDELRSLLVLLLRHYNPKYHSKQYLQDLIVTNHILLTFIDNVMKLPAYNGTTNMLDHIRQFATTDVMYQYGLLLEDYTVNGEFVNDCIFTVMHHVGGELASLITLFQPKILKTFASICKSEFEICDDWSDLIEHVINTFIKKPHTLQSAANFRLDTKSFDDEKGFVKPLPPGAVNRNNNNETDGKKKATGATSSSSKDKWTDEELSSLSWNYMQCNVLPDSIGELVKMFKEDGIITTRDSIIRELFSQNLICNDEFDKLIKGENEINNKGIQMNKEMRDNEISKLCEQLAQDGKLKYLEWVQKVLLDTCYAKIYVEKKSKLSRIDSVISKLDFLLQNVKKTYDELPVMSPVCYHSLLFNQSVPLVPWNCEQAFICKDLKFLQLLHLLGFHMPVESGRVFIRIPHFWTAKFIYEVAGKILIVDTSKLKFRLSDIANSSTAASAPQNHFILTEEVTKDATFIETSENIYQIHKQKHLAAMVNFTPMPGTSFNPEGGELNKPNWFELVQKSQEYKITLKLKTWTDEELSSLSWNYMQCNVLPDSIGELVKMFKEDGIITTRDSIIRELFSQNLICNDEFDKLIKGENEINNKGIQMNKEMRDNEISKLCEQLAQDGKLKYLEWVQKVLLDTCYAKIYVEKKSKLSRIDSVISKLDFLLQNVKKTYDELPVMSPVCYHSLLFNQSVPLVPWNCEQAFICKDLKFLQLLHLLGFHMPVDSGRVFIRIPHFWTAKFIYEVAGKILIVDTSKLKFRLSDIANSSTAASAPQNHFILTEEVTKDATFIETSENIYQIHKQKHLAAMVNFTPMPGTSFNPEGGELNKPNWFELVQKSQEYKITLKLKTSSSLVGEDAHSDVVMHPSPPSAYPPRAAFPPPPPASLPSPIEMMMPALRATMSVKIETSNYSLHHAEAENNNSVCETASVASDLMYVSDEDEKSHILISPVKSFPIIDDHDQDQHLSSDLDATCPGKRPRVHLSPTL